jgi:endonuclease YncB( thermonuclease family)
VIRQARGEVLEVVDGDTVHTMLDIGWGIVLRPRIGKLGGGGTIRIMFPDGTPFDAPERGTPQGKVAQDLARRFVLPGQRLEVVSHGLDDWSRTLGSVTWANGRDWATSLAELGLVKR